MWEHERMDDSATAILEILDGDANISPSFAGSQQFRNKGVPQGMPLSPLLSTLYLEETLMTDHDIVMYADDGLIFDKPGQYLSQM